MHLKTFFSPLTIDSSSVSQQCLMQSNSQQSQQLNRDLISPSPYQCHMSVRSGPLTPGPSVSASSLAAAAAAAYDSLGLVSGPNSTSTYNTSRHSPSSPSQTTSAGGLYSFNSNSSVPFGLPNSSNGTGKFSSNSLLDKFVSFKWNSISFRANVSSTKIRILPI